jgi:hypothetical protein
MKYGLEHTGVVDEKQTINACLRNIISKKTKELQNTRITGRKNVTIEN